MNRRRFLKVLGSLPFVGVAVITSSVPVLPDPLRSIPIDRIYRDEIDLMDPTTPNFGFKDHEYMRKIFDEVDKAQNPAYIIKPNGDILPLDDYTSRMAKECSRHTDQIIIKAALGA